MALNVYYDRSFTFRRSKSMMKSTRPVPRTVYLLAVATFITPFVQAADSPATKPDAAMPTTQRSLTASQDHHRTMQLLNLSEPGKLPPEADDPNRPQNTRPQGGRSSNYTDDAHNTYVRSGWGNWSNYDEAKANPYPLPDPLILKNGQPVKDADTWWKVRRPEIANDFATEIYGKIPDNTPAVTWEVTSTDTHALNGMAIMKKIVGHIDNSANPSIKPTIPITMYIPAAATGPVPMMVIIGGFGGGFGRPGFGPGRRPVPAGAAAAPTSRPAFPSAMPLALAAGWGYATVDTGSVQQDSGAGFSRGIIGLMSGGQPRKPDDWGVLVAWSWGLSRAMDYFETDKSVDAKRIGIEGHSRWGKEALLAAAMDPRWAICYSSCSGQCGAKLSRRSWGETVDNVAGEGEYHWMAGNFLKYGGHWNDMPVDSHELIAMVAPRPILITGGTSDQWSDPHGEFLAAVAAGPVYRLLGKGDLGTSEMPAPDVALDAGELAFREHNGGHTDMPDWPVFIKFAQRYFGASATAK
jgi:hypothetical protein